MAHIVTKPQTARRYTFTENRLQQIGGNKVKISTVRLKTIAFDD